MRSYRNRSTIYMTCEIRTRGMNYTTRPSCMAERLNQVMPLSSSDYETINNENDLTMHVIYVRSKIYILLKKREEKKG